MKDEREPRSGKASTAELEDETKHPEHEPGGAGASAFAKGDRPAAGTATRHTTAGLGMYDRVTSIAGTTGFGIAPGIGAMAEKPSAIETVPGITGVDLTYSEGEPGTTHASRFSEEEDSYWRESYPSRPYAQSGRNYDEYRPAYQYGTDAAHRYQGRRWEDVEGDLERGWGEARGHSRLAWQDIKEAVRDAWHRVERALPGDADRDGR